MTAASSTPAARTPFCGTAPRTWRDLIPVYLSDLEVQDIDTEQDWELAELKYRRLNERKG